MGVMSVGSLSGYLELEDRLSPALRLAERNLATTGARLDELGDRLKRTGSDLLPLSAGLLAAGGASSVMAATFDASMTRLVSTAGVADDEIETVREHILALAPASGIGPQTLADAMMKVSSTVSDTATAMNILDIAAQGTKAGFGETVDVAGALTTVLNSYGASNITAAHAGDVLAMAIKEGGAEAKELAPTLANVVPFAAQLGVSFEEVAANIATLTKLGVPTSEAVTQLTSVFTALSKETKQGTDALTAMGTSYGAIREQIREKGLAATLTDLAQRFKGNETVMLDVFGRIEAVKNIMGTAGVQAETYAEVLEKVQGSSDKAGGALKGMADAMSGKTVQTWGELTATLKVLAIEVGDALAPALGELMKMAIPVLGWVGDAVKAFGELPAPIQAVGFAVVGMMAVAGPALFALGTVSSIAGVAATGLGLLSGAIAAVGGVARVTTTAGLSPMIVGMSASGAAASAAAGGMAAASTAGEALTLVMGGLATAVALVGAAFAGWKFGKWIGDMKMFGEEAMTLAESTEFSFTKISNWIHGVKATDHDIKTAITSRRGLSESTRDSGKAALEAADANVVWGSGIEKVVDKIHILTEAEKKAAEDGAKAVAENLKIERELIAKAWSDKAAMLDFNGQRAIDELERQFNEWHSATTRNLKIDEDMHKSSALLKARMYDDAGMAELKRIDDHYKRVTQFSKAALQQIADDAWKDYAEATAASGQFSDAAIQHFKDVAEAAQEAADGGVSGFKGAIDDISRVLDESATAWHRLAEVTESSVVRMMAAITSGAAIIVKDIKGILEAKDAIGAVLAVVNLAVDAIALMWDALTRSPGEDVMRRVRGWGVDITEALGDSIAETAKKLFGGSRQAAEIFRLGDILDAAGGLTSGNFDTFLAKLRDTFVMLETGAFTSGQAVEVLDENFGAFAAHATQHGRLVSDRFLEIIRLADAAGIRVEAINEFVIGQATGAVTGLNALITNSTITSQTAANGLTAALGASFDELTKRGMSAADAIAMMGPTIDALEIQLVENGLVGSAAFAEIRAMSVLAADEIGGPLLDAIHGGAQAITGLHNAGILTQEMFSGLTAQVTSTFNSLVEQGHDGAAALALVGRDIQKIWEAQQDFGFEVDDSTQRLIDQAIEAGKVGEAHRDAQDRAVRAMEGAAAAMQRVGDTLERVFGSAGDDSEEFADRVREAIEGIPTEVRVGVHFDVDRLPGGEGPYDFGPNADEWSWNTPGDFVSDDFTPGPSPNSNANGPDMIGLVDMLGNRISDLTSALPSLMENAVRHGVQTAGRRI